MYLLILQEGKLFQGDVGGMNGMEVICNYFGDDFVYVGAQGYGLKIIEC